MVIIIIITLLSLRINNQPNTFENEIPRPEGKLIADRTVMDLGTIYVWKEDNFILRKRKTAWTPNLLREVYMFRDFYRLYRGIKTYV